MTTSGINLARDLVCSLLGEGPFAPGRPEAQSSLARLSEKVCAQLQHKSRVMLLGGNPTEPLRNALIGFGEQSFDSSMLVDEKVQDQLAIRLAGFWRDRRLALVALRQGLTSQEFCSFYHDLLQHAGKGLLLRKRFYSEQMRGRFPHVCLIFLDDLTAVDAEAPWSARTALSWLFRDLNLLSRVHGLSSAEQLNWRKEIYVATLELSHLTGRLTDFFAYFDSISEKIDDYDKDELVFALLEHLDEDLAGDVCLQLCERISPLLPKDDEGLDPELKKRRDAMQWIARRLAEQMIEQDEAAPEHFHALVLGKVFLYEEIPEKVRARVASLQVLTSFLADPQKYFNEVETSHSPEVLETRLWRILEMLPRLIEVLRFDVAGQVIDFAKRFGPTFDVHNKPEIMSALMEASAGVLTETKREHQATLMKMLPLMGSTGVHLLIDLADHSNRSVRRTALDALIKVGQPVVPILFATLETKQGWHYLRNMILLLAQLNAGGPKVEKLFRFGLSHAEPNVRKESLVGITRLLKGEAAGLVSEALDDNDPEVRRCAAACLSLTGIVNQEVCQKLARLLTARSGSEELALQIVSSLNRLKLPPPSTPALENALIDLLGKGGFLGIGGRKGSASQTLRVSVVQSLGYVGTTRAAKVLARLESGQNSALAKAVEQARARIASR